MNNYLYLQKSWAKEFLPSRDEITKAAKIRYKANKEKVNFLKKLKENWLPALLGVCLLLILVIPQEMFPQQYFVIALSLTILIITLVWNYIDYRVLYKKYFDYIMVRRVFLNLFLAKYSEYAETVGKHERINLYNAINYNVPRTQPGVRGIASLSYVFTENFLDRPIYSREDLDARINTFLQDNPEEGYSSDIKTIRGTNVVSRKIAL